MKKKNEKGQVAIEYLVMVVFLLMVVSLAAAYALFTYYETIRVNQGRNVVFKLGKAADQTYALGPDNSIFVEVLLPAGIQVGSTAQGKEITYKIQMYGGVSDFVYGTKGNITPTNLPINEGVHIFQIKVVDENITITEV